LGLRHLHFTQSLEPLHGGGLGTSSIALHRELLAQRAQSTLCATYGKTPINPAPRTWEFKRAGPECLYFSPELCRKARALVGSTDVLHGHGFYVGTNFLFGSEARRQKKPLVYHVHGTFEPWILSRSGWKKRLVHWLFEDANFRHARLWRALTCKEADQIRACGIKAPVVIVPNGLDLSEFPERAEPDEVIETPLVWKLTKTRRRALFLGRIHPKKGLDLLLPCWAKLAALRKDWELVIAGPDDRGHLRRMQVLAESLGLAKEVIFVGPVTGDVKTALLYSADFFVLPSYSEGFPMSLLEGMACHVPIVATTNCNFPEIPLAGAGWECEANPNSMFDVLSRAVSADDSERRQRGENGRHLVQSRYLWPRIVSQLLEACGQHC
jgi:glycosyltransferase involved in cell wall biosynthesis